MKAITVCWACFATWSVRPAVKATKTHALCSRCQRLERDKAHRRALELGLFVRLGA